jgi:hypothetical protein
MTTVRLQRRHFSSTPSWTRRANKLPQPQRKSSCAQARWELEGTIEASFVKLRRDCVMDVLDETRLPHMLLKVTINSLEAPRRRFELKLTRGKTTGGA